MREDDMQTFAVMEASKDRLAIIESFLYFGLSIPCSHFSNSNTN